MEGQEPDVGSLSAPSLVPKPASGSTGDDPVDHDPVGHDSVGHDSVDAGPIDEESRFRSVFDETYRPLVAYARRRTTDWSEADDIVAEAFSVAWRRRAELPADNPLPWLYAVAANVLRNHRRATSRRLRLVDKIEAQPNPAPAPDPADLDGTSMRRALASLGDARGAPTLRASLARPDRAFPAAIGLGDLRDRDSADALLRLAGHRWRSPILRAAAARALVRLGDPEGARIIRTLVRSWRIEARQYAVQLVGELGLTTLVPDLARAFRRSRKAERPVYETTFEQLAPRSAEAKTLLASLRQANHSV